MPYRIGDGLINGGQKVVELGSGQSSLSTKALHKAANIGEVFRAGEELKVNRAGTVLPISHRAPP
jgi:hypothetical protein